MTPIAVVTGGGRGIGRGIAQGLAEDGLDVVITYRSDADAAAAVVGEIERMGQRALAVRADVTEASAGEAIVEATVSAFGRLDIVVNNAGRMVTRPFLETTSDEYDLQHATNARGSFFVAQAAARQMVRQGDGGNIVLITSRAAGKAIADLSGYCMSKAALGMLCNVLAIELAPFGVRVNAVAPATTETDLNREALKDPVNRERLLGRILLGRPGSPRDVAAAVRFLVSNGAEFVTGCTVAVDGGAAIN